MADRVEVEQKEGSVVNECLPEPHAELLSSGEQQDLEEKATRNHGQGSGDSCSSPVPASQSSEPSTAAQQGTGLIDGKDSTSPQPASPDDDAARVDDLRERFEDNLTIGGGRRRMNRGHECFFGDGYASDDSDMQVQLRRAARFLEMGEEEDERDSYLEYDDFPNYWDGPYNL